MNKAVCLHCAQQTGNKHAKLYIKTEWDKHITCPHICIMAKPNEQLDLLNPMENAFHYEWKENIQAVLNLCPYQTEHAVS